MTPLKGFGVLLDIKNMEYTAVDDLDRSGVERDAEGSADDTDGVGDGDGGADDGPAFEKGEAVAGIVFDTLQARAQVPTSDLLVLREVLLESASSAPADLKVSICMCMCMCCGMTKTRVTCSSALPLDIDIPNPNHSLQPERARAVPRCGRCETLVCRLRSSLWMRQTRP